MKATPRGMEGVARNSLVIRLGAPLDSSEGQHGIGNLCEAGDVGTQQVITWLAIGLSCFKAGLMNALHDAVQALVNFISIP